MPVPGRRSLFRLIAAAAPIGAAAIILSILAGPSLSPLFGGGRAEAATVTVRVGDSWFCDPTGPQPCGQPHDTVVNAGDTVVWEWGPGGAGTFIVHTTTHCPDGFATCGTPKEWDSSPAQDSGTFSHAFGPEDAGKTFLYRCEIHPTFMRGRIIVQAAATPTPTPTPAPTATPGPGDDTDGDTIVNGDDLDDDGDGYFDDDETAKGSDPFDAASTPEHADGIDNDGDTEVDEEPTQAAWDIDADMVKDSLDPDVDTDGDGMVNTLDDDDDGDGATDSNEQFMSVDELGNCSMSAVHDALPPDSNGDKSLDIGDVLALFGQGKVLDPTKYNRRADFNADGLVDIGDVLNGFGSGKVLTKCAVFTFPNDTGGVVDDIHIVWSGAIAEVFSALDTDLGSWSDRTLSSDGLTLDLTRPAGDLAGGGQLTIVVRSATSTTPTVSSCEWTLDGVGQGTC